jgi:hypothetical protein
MTFKGLKLTALELEEEDEHACVNHHKGTKFKKPPHGKGDPRSMCM